MPRRVPLRRALARAARGRAGHARRPLPLGRVRRAAAADRLGPLGGHGARPRRRPLAGGAERRHDPRPRPLRGRPARRRAGGRAGRGDGLRGAQRPDVHAGRLDLAHRGDHPRPGDRDARAGGAGRAAVLEGRGRGPALRAGRGRRPPGARAGGGGARAGRRPAARRERLRGARRRQPGRLPRGPGGRDRRRAERPRDRDRALPRRDRRLAPLRADALRRARPRALGPGAGRAPARRPPARRRTRSGATTASPSTCPTPTRRRPPTSP